MKWKYTPDDFADDVHISNDLHQDIHTAVRTAYRETYPTSPLDTNLRFTVTNIQVTTDNVPIGAEIDHDTLPVGTTLRFTVRVFVGRTPGQTYTGKAVYTETTLHETTPTGHPWEIDFHRPPSLVTRVTDRLKALVATDQ